LGLKIFKGKRIKKSPLEKPETLIEIETETTTKRIDATVAIEWI
jgi:hypothetical protein